MLSISKQKCIPVGRFPVKGLPININVCWYKIYLVMYEWTLILMLA